MTRKQKVCFVFAAEQKRETKTTCKNTKEEVNMSASVTLTKGSLEKCNFQRQLKNAYQHVTLKGKLQM